MTIKGSTKNEKKKKRRWKEKVEDYSILDGQNSSSKE